MIDFTLSELDQRVLDTVREQALITRKYARPRPTSTRAPTRCWAGSARTTPRSAS